MSNLKKFRDDEIVIDQSTAWAFLRFFWPDTSVRPGDISRADISFAQALMVEALDASASMGLTEILFRTFMGPANVVGSLSSHVVRLLRVGFLHWYRNARNVDLQHPKVYEAVRVTLARNYRSVWAVRQQTGELIY